MPERTPDPSWDQEAYEGLLEASPDPVVLVDRRGHIVLANAHAERLFGFDRSEMVGRPARMLFPEDLAAPLVAHHAEYVEKPGVRVLGREDDLRGRRKDDSEFPIEIAVAPMRVHEPLLIAATVRDVTRKRREEGLFRGLLEAAPDAMVIVDGRGSIVLVNAQVEKLFGYDRNELVGQPVETLVPERFARMHVEFRESYVSEPRTRPIGLAGDLYARRKDGSEFPAEISLAPLQTDEGLLVSAAVRDISERKLAWADSDRIKEEFFATVSHELRTPLTSMIGYSELMSDLEELSPQGKRFLSVITRSAERELRLVDDLLTLVQIDESGLEIRPADIDLEAVVRDAVEAARPPAEEAALDLSLEIPGFAVPVVGDADRLGQALDNLLSNAIKFTPANGRIRVVLRAGAEVAEIDVVDSGSGIGEVDPERLFERLYRASDAFEKQIPGAGLGLPIAKAIIEAHHGTISAHAAPGRGGTTFRIRLPK